MREIVSTQAIYPALRALLGLPDRCISFEFRMAAGQLGVTVSCEHYVPLDEFGIKQLEVVLSQYELVRREPEVDRISANALGFDAWLRNRIELAHADFMRRTGAHLHYEQDSTPIK